MMFCKIDTKSNEILNLLMSHVCWCIIDYSNYCKNSDWFLATLKMCMVQLSIIITYVVKFKNIFLKYVTCI